MRVLCQQNECPICRRLNQKVALNEFHNRYQPQSADLIFFRVLFFVWRWYLHRRYCRIENWIKRIEHVCIIKIIGYVLWARGRAMRYNGCSSIHVPSKKERKVDAHRCFKSKFIFWNGEWFAFLLGAQRNRFQRRLPSRSICVRSTNYFIAIYVRKT